jgi:hypothetical protein
MQKREARATMPALLTGTTRPNSTRAPSYGRGLAGTVILAGSAAACAGPAGSRTGDRLTTGGSPSGSSSCSALAQAVLNRSAGTAIPIA